MKIRFYRFTNKRHPQKGIMSTVLGLIALVSVCLAIYMTYLTRGEAPVRYGTTALFALILALVGFWLGMDSRTAPDSYHFFCYFGMIVSGVTVVLTVFITVMAYYVT